MLQEETKKSELNDRKFVKLEKMPFSNFAKFQEERICYPEPDANSKDMQMNVIWQILNKVHQNIIGKLLGQGTVQKASYDHIIKKIRILANEGGSSFCNSVKVHILKNNYYQSIKKIKSHEGDIGNVWRDKLISEQIATLEFRAMECPLPIKAGYNMIRFHVREGAESPSSLPELNSGDARSLSIAIKNIMIMSKGYQIPFVMGNNCYNAEYSNGEEFKWISNDAIILVHSEDTTNAALSFSLLSFYRPRTLELYIKPLANREVNNARKIRFVPLNENKSNANKAIIGREISAIISHIEMELP